MLPLVSVVIPTLGRPSLAAALDSVRRQRVYTEVLLVDDSGSRAVQALGDEQVVRTSGLTGAAAARNLGMQAAKGEFIAFLDDDDEWLPGHLEDAIALLRARPEIDVYAARGLVIDETGGGRIEPTVLVGARTVEEYFFERRASMSRCRRILTPTLVFRASLASHHMEPGRHVNEDTWWLLTAERDRGARLVQSDHIGVVVHGSKQRTSGRRLDGMRKWLDEIEALRPGAAATEQLTMDGRAAVRAGQPVVLAEIARDVLGRHNGWTWLPLIAAHGAAAAAVRARRAGRHRLNRVRHD